MEKIKFKFMVRNNGHVEFAEFLESLPRKDQQKLLSVIHKVEKFGLPTALKMQWVKKLNREIYELRSKVGSNIQRGLYFYTKDNLCIITHGFTKKTQKTPIRELNHAEKLMREFLSNEED